ncbi:MAG: hypothetical protein IIC06_08735 [Proteobacteria bacterium]|nr:hypothetical protein [Pseudomonadota bacterium]
MRTAIKAVFGLALLVLLAACASQERRGPNLRSSANKLIFASYAAVDRLLQNAQGKLDSTKPLLVSSLVNIDNFNSSSSFGRLVGEQLVSRLVVSGYSVIELTLRDSLLVKKGSGQFILSRDVKAISKSSNAQAVVAGTYTVAATDVFVNLRLIRASDGKILSAHDFAVRKSANVAALVSSFQSDLGLNELVR